MKLKTTTFPFGALVLSSLLFASVAAAKTTATVESTETLKQTTTVQPSQSFEHIVELLPEDFKPAFTRNTVIKLNAIVKRSYAVIREFDELSKEMEKNMPGPTTKLSAEQLKDLVQHKLTVSQSLEMRSKSALTDMKQAAEVLKNSGEHYNAAVLAGMMTFVKDVEREVTGSL